MKNSKSIEKGVGVKVKIVHSMAFFFTLFLLLFINEASADIQTTCNITDPNEVVLNYTVPLRDSEENAIVNATITLTVDGQMTDVTMLNSTITGEADGTYLCAISRNFTTGNFPTSYVISTDFGEFTDTGSFTVTYFDYDIALVAAILIISGLFLFLSFRSEDRVLNPLFFFLGILLIIVNFFITAELSFNSSIEAIMRRLYSTLIIIYSLGVMLYGFVGYFIPFVQKAFVRRRRTDTQVETEIP